jgi:hypothetical protein
MTQEITYPMIKITSELFGVIHIPANDFEDSGDIWDSLGHYLDINVYDVGDGTIQATIYPVENKIINTDHIIESLQGDNIEIITS